MSKGSVGLSHFEWFEGGRGRYRFLRFASLLALCAGCTVDVASQGEGAGEGEVENVSESTEEVIIGSWAGPFTNGNVGQSPLLWWEKVVCEVFHGGPALPWYFYPGRLVNGSCHFVRNGQPLIGNTYWALQQQGFYELQNPGFTPNNAIAGSGPGKFAVCRPSWDPSTSGRVQGGYCHYEHSGIAFQTDDFVFMINY
jgi:hypothetical protein